MSKNNTFQTAVLNRFKGVAGILPDTWRLAIIVASTNLEGDAFTKASYSGYADLSVTAGEMTVSGNQLVINADKEFAAVAGADMDFERYVLEASADGGSTWPWKVYSDTDLATNVPVGVRPKCPANTGFVWSED